MDGEWVNIKYEKAGMNKNTNINRDIIYGRSQNHAQNSII